MVRDSPPRSDVQHRLLARGQVDERVALALVPSAAALGEQHHQVDEGEAEAPDDDGLTGGQCAEVAVGGEVGRQVDEAVAGGEACQGLLLRVGFGVEVAHGEDDEVGEEGCGGAFQPDPLAPLAGAADPHGGGAVFVDGDGGGQRGAGPLVHPAQIGALLGAGGEGAAVDAGPFGDGGSGPDGARQVHGLVGEHGDVLGPGVHPEQRGLFGAPDPAGAGRVRVDEVDVEGAVAVHLGQVGGEPFEEAGPPRPGAHDHDRGTEAHRAPAVPRA